MSEVGITVEENAQMKALRKRMGKPVVGEMAKAMLASAHVAAKHLAAEAPRDTSQLARSFLANVGFVQQSPTEVITRTHSPLPYAGVQDKGGVVRPRTAKALAIPFTSQAKARWPRDWPQDRLALIKVRGKAFLIERASGGGAKPTFHYILKDRIQIQGTGYVEKARVKAQPEIHRLMSERLAEIFRSLT